MPREPPKTQTLAIVSNRRQNHLYSMKSLTRRICLISLAGLLLACHSGCAYSRFGVRAGSFTLFESSPRQKSQHELYKEYKGKGLDSQTAGRYASDEYYGSATPQQRRVRNPRTPSATYVVPKSKGD